VLSAFGRPVLDLPPPSPEETLVWMRRLAMASQADVRLRGLATSIVRRLKQQDYISEYAAILDWVRRHIRYVRDPRTVEQVSTPQATLSVGTGDCDDMAVLISSLVGHIGGSTRFRAGAFKRSGGVPMLSHVWVEAFDPATRAWVVLDPVPGQRVNSMLSGLVATLTAPAID